MRVERDSSGVLLPLAKFIVTDEIEIFEPLEALKLHKKRQKNLNNFNDTGVITFASFMTPVSP